jgi:hypothetical protein
VSTYNLQLKFHSGDVEKGELPFAMAQIALKTWTHDSAEGAPLISPDCVSVIELDFEVDRLHAELEEIRRRGHAQFAANQSKKRSAYLKRSDSESN